MLQNGAVFRAMMEHPSVLPGGSILRDDGTEASTTSPIREGKKVERDVSRYFMYKRNGQTRNLLRSRKSFTFITNLIHLLPEGGTQMQLNLSENLMLQFLPSRAMAMRSRFQ